MKQWLRISLFLCIFGFMREIRPSESFLSAFILGPWRNITSEQLNRDIFPVGTYSCLAQSFLVFLITDYLRYKPLIIVIGISGIIISSLLIWSKSILSLQIMEFVYGTYMASEVAYYTYIYAKVDKKYYPKVTSHTRAAMLAGRLVASILSQVLVSFKLMDYMELNYITLAAQICATFWAFMLPSVKNSLYFHRDDKSLTTSSALHKYDDTLTNNDDHPERKYTAFALLWLQFKNAYTNLKVLQWSLWYALGVGGNLQFICYMQVLWNEIDNNPEIAWNGAVDAVLTFLGTLCALVGGYMHAGRLSAHGSLLLLSGLSILQGGAILLTAWTSSLYYSYTGYIIFGALYAFTITVTSSEIARHLTDDSYGLVFGINTLIGLLLQTILTLFVVSENGFALNVIEQYAIYAYYFIGIGILYILFVINDYYFCKNLTENEKNQITK